MPLKRSPSTTMKNQHSQEIKINKMGEEAYVCKLVGVREKVRNEERGETTWRAISEKRTS